MFKILGIHLANPAKAGEKLQDILTKYGCTIRTRMGLHNDEEDGSEGLIILELMSGRFFYDVAGLFWKSSAMNKFRI